MPSDDEIFQLTKLILETTPRLPIDRDEVSPALQGSTLSAHVEIDGAWKGRIRFVCDADVAVEAAGIMFGLSRPDTTYADLQDAVGELANMIGGNVKALLPGPCSLSTPRIDSGDCAPEGRLIQSVRMHSSGKAVCVEVIESQGDASEQAAALRD